MKLIHAILALCIGIMVGIGLTAAGLAMAQNPAQVQARLNAQAALGVPAYVKDSVSVNGEVVNILEDHKRNRVVYFMRNSSGSSRTVAVDVLDRRNPR